MTTTTAVLGTLRKALATIGAVRRRITNNVGLDPERRETALQGELADLADFELWALAELAAHEGDTRLPS